jgi:adhesin/invasin
LDALVLDANGQPVSGAAVDFQIDTGTAGASAVFTSGGTQATAISDANGIATSPGLIANGSPGHFAATASIDGVTPTVSFELRNLATRLTAVARGEAGTVDSRYRRPLRARVTDVHGRPIQGVSVTFALPQAATGAGASFLGGSSQATATTDTRGEASSPPILANGTAGRFTATATIAADPKPIVYSLHNLAAQPAAIAIGAASGEATPTGSRFPIRLAVTVTDKDGNPVSGTLVTFAAPAGRGPGGYFTIQDRKRHRSHASRIARVRTDRNGVAIAPAFSANAQAGGYAVTVRAGGAKAAFALVNNPR